MLKIKSFWKRKLLFGLAVFFIGNISACQASYEIEQEPAVQEEILPEEDTGYAVRETECIEEETEFLWESNDPFWEAVRESYQYKKDFVWEDILSEESLWLSCSQDMDFSQLKEFKNLNSLSINFDSMDEYPDISCIGELENLKSLWITGYPLGTEYGFLEKMDFLETLELTRCNLTDLELVRKLPNLTSASFNENEICDIAPITSCKNLRRLALSDNEILDISPLGEMKNLDALYLDGNKIRDISPISGAAGMEYLNISFNEIEDFTPIWGMEHLYSLSIGGNPGDNVGERLLTPIIDFGSGYKTKRPQEWEENRQKAEEIFFDIFPAYVGDGAEIIDFAWGDFDGDGREDLAVTCDNPQWEWNAERKIFILFEDGRGSYPSFVTVDVMQGDSGGLLGDPYVGIYCVDGYFIVQNYGGSSGRWEVTEIYQYNGREMEKLWELTLEHSTFTIGNEWTVNDLKAGSAYRYAIASDEEGKKKQLLLASYTGEGQRERLLQEITETVETMGKDWGVELPEIASYYYVPDVDGGYYDYHYHDTMMELSMSPQEILDEAAERYLTNAVTLPVSFYTSDEIKDNYDRLAGVELPWVFYLGKMDGIPSIIAYDKCSMEEAGAVHRVEICQLVEDWDKKEKIWRRERVLLYREETETWEEEE